MILDSTAALFVLLGQTAERIVAASPELAPAESLELSLGQDLADLLPAETRAALNAATPYKLFFIFEGYLRSLVVDTLSSAQQTWWEKVPPDVQQEVERLEQTEEMKAWMALGARDKSALLTYPQLLRVIDHNWKSDFSQLVRDKTLINQARAVAHLRNTLCHMSAISDEEEERVRQVMRDWFRMVAP